MFKNRFLILLAAVLLVVGGLLAYQFIDLNSSDMNNFIKANNVVSAENKKTAMFANGCFWCVEHDLEKVTGVISVVSGYAGGTTPNPTYENYGAGGHREVVEVTYDVSVISYANLVEHIIKHGNPTDGGGSFFDRGSQYTPAIYYSNEEEKEQADFVIEKINTAGVYDSPLAISVEPVLEFFPAEEYHQDYAKENPLKYGYYRNASGRTAFIEDVWGEDLKYFNFSGEVKVSTGGNQSIGAPYTPQSWENFVLPSETELRSTLSDIEYKVTQKDGTERAGSSPYDGLYDYGIFVDIVSGEPLFSSKDKFDSRTGWPSFVKPITDDVVAFQEDKTFWSVRTEVRSRYANSHLGHVFDDGPADRGGLRYCMNGAAMRFVPKEDMESEGYSHWLQYLE